MHFIFKTIFKIKMMKIDFIYNIYDELPRDIIEQLPQAPKELDIFHPSGAPSYKLSGSFFKKMKEDIENFVNEEFDEEKIKRKSKER